MQIVRTLMTDIIILSVLEALKGPAVFVDVDGRLRVVNAQGAKVLQCDAKIIAQTPFSSWIDAENRADWEKEKEGRFYLSAQGATVRFKGIYGPNGQRAGFVGQIEVAERSNSAWQVIVENLQDGVWDINLADGRNYHSTAWFSMRGLSETASAGIRFEEWLGSVHPDDRAEVKNYATALREGQASRLSIQFRERHSDGRWLWILSRGAVVEKDAEGRAIRVVGADADISGFMRSKDSLRASTEIETRWQIAGESTQQGLWDHDFERGTVYHSPSWRKMRGYGMSDAIPDTVDKWLACLHPDDRDAVCKSIDAINNGATDNIAYEYRERHMDGHWIWLLSRGQVVLRDHDGHPLRVIGTDTDISTMKAANDAVAKTQQRLAVAVSTARIGIWEYDLATNSTFWDARTREIYGLPPSDEPLPAMYWESAIHPDDLERTERASFKAVENRTDFQL